MPLDDSDAGELPVASWCIAASGVGGRSCGDRLERFVIIESMLSAVVGTESVLTMVDCSTRTGLDILSVCQHQVQSKGPSTYPEVVK